MTTISSAGTMAGVGTGFLDKERTIAAAGFNRWLVPPAALCIHLCIGKAVGHADAQMNAERGGRHQPAIEAGGRNRSLFVEETGACAGYASGAANCRH